MSNSADSKVQPLKLDQIRIDGGTQVRVEINDDAVAEYAEARKAGDILPPIIVFFDGSDHWLSDGFHRFFSAKHNGSNSIRAEVRPGTRRDAILFAVGSNTVHGLRRSNADKRHAIETLLKDEEWEKKSDRWIAEAAHVSDHLVADVRAQVRERAPENGTGGTDNGDSGTRTGRDGKRYRVTKKTHRKVTRTAASKQETDDEEVNDGLGNPVTDKRLRPAFEIAQELGRMVRQVSTIRTFLKEKVVGTDIGSRLVAEDLRHWDTELDDLHRFLKFARPHAVCVYCKASDRKCPACKGQGWINKISYDQAPAEKKPK
ncbi:MAG: hypothetical protein V3T84_14585 [Phycisphaerales bacterium]